MSARYPEPRDWVDCDLCQSGRRDRYDEEGNNALDGAAPCPECGQPPRCHMGRRVPSHCSRPATVPMFADGCLVMCGQHHDEQTLYGERHEYEAARRFVDLFSSQAYEIGSAALEEVLEAAADMCDARVATLDAQRAEIPW